jgi:serine/threonine protein kinase/tetratricopeptide (TPR) repeat protein
VPPSSIAHYRIDRQLGEGGMGVVYAAFDERLQRPLAIKMLRTETTDPQGRHRLWREARAAAGLSHPNICQVFDVGEADDQVYVAMELLEGESLATRLLRGPLPPREAYATALAILAALDALHRRGLVHRDLKPSNVFLTPHGVKLLDFGLALSLAPSLTPTTTTRITLPGTVLGTPQYISPEQVRGETVDQRVDIFAMGAVLIEMLTGEPPFTGPTAVDVLHSVLHDAPPVLTGDRRPADAVAARALAKRTEDRFESARAMADALRLIVADTGSTPRPAPATGRVLARLIVLPFRLLRADPEIEFLTFSLADAITTSLTGLRALIVRSSVTAARFSPDSLDLDALARQADVDVALTGTLLRVRTQVRVAAQLIEVPAGTVLWSDTSTASLDDVFRLQDDLAQRIVSSLELPLTAREHRLMQRDVPATASAYEQYLRGVQLGTSASTWPAARDCLERCIADDPKYAPAWARLGRLYRLLAKYSHESDAAELARAEAALRRALELNPDLGLAHVNAAVLEVELGHAPAAMTRLLELTRVMPNDATLYAGLVHACRYGGLLDASLAAQQRARMLDPSINTSVANTYFMLGQYRRGLESSDQPFDLVRSLSEGMLGNDEAALAETEREHDLLTHGTLRAFVTIVRTAIVRDHAACRQAIAAFPRSAFRDPEGCFYLSLASARIGDCDDALWFLRRAVFGGFACPVPLRHNPWLEGVRSHPAFMALVEEADARHQQAVDAYAAAAGPSVLAVPARTQQI